MSKTKTIRIKLNEKTTSCLKLMVQEIKSQGDHIKLSPTDLNEWIINNFYKFHFEKKIDTLNFKFTNDETYIKSLLASNMTIDQIERKLREFSKKKANILKKDRKIAKLSRCDEQLSTTTKLERKVEFEE